MLHDQTIFSNKFSWLPAQGDQITFGGWAYLESGVASDLGWLLQAENSSQQGIAWYPAAPKAASAGWVFQSATYVVPSGVSYVALYAQIWQATAASVLRVDDGFLYDDRLSVTTVQNLDYLPFGELNSSDSGISTHKFTGDERDSETNLDHTWFRQYSSQFARWTSPDPAGLAAVDPSNPQSWNRYSYVNDDPMNFVDPWGLYTACVTTPNGPGGGSITECVSYPDQNTGSSPLPTHFPDAGAGGGHEAFTCTGFVRLNCGPSRQPLDIKSLKLAATRNQIRRYNSCVETEIHRNYARSLAYGAWDAFHGVSWAGFVAASMGVWEISLAVAPTPDAPVDAAGRVILLAQGTGTTALGGTLIVKGQQLAAAESAETLQSEAAKCSSILAP